MVLYLGVVRSLVIIYVCEIFVLIYICIYMRERDFLIMFIKIYMMFYGLIKYIVSVVIEFY